MKRLSKPLILSCCLLTLTLPLKNLEASNPKCRSVLILAGLATVVGLSTLPFHPTTNSRKVVSSPNATGPTQIQIETRQFLHNNGIILKHPLKILHLGQIHFTEESSSDPRVSNQIFVSQLDIMNFLLKHPHSKVFLEGNPVNLTTINRQNLELEFQSGALESLVSSDPNDSVESRFLEIRKAFPNGLDPKQIDMSDNQVELSINQIKVIIRYGGAQILWALGLTDGGLYSTVDPQIEAKVSQVLDKLNSASTAQDRARAEADWKRYVQIGRERAALYFAALDFVQNPTNSEVPVIIIFGSGHDFVQHSFENLKIQRVSLPQ